MSSQSRTLPRPTAPARLQYPHTANALHSLQDRAHIRKVFGVLDGTAKGSVLANQHEIRFLAIQSTLNRDAPNTFFAPVASPLQIYDAADPSLYADARPQPHRDSRECTPLLAAEGAPLHPPTTQVPPAIPR